MSDDDHWQLIEITGVGLGELWFDVVADELDQRTAERRASNRERYAAVPMPYNPDEEVGIGEEVDSYTREVVSR
jgi:hypothetical protein